VHRKKLKVREKMGKVKVNLRAYLNKHVGSDKTSNFVIAIDKDFDIYGSKKDPNSNN